jgi:hypothetical protein
LTKPQEDIAASIPEDLADADELLRMFGRWAMARLTRRSCGSAEGQYRPKKGEEAFELAREPREIIMGTQEAMQVQKALSRVPTKWRLILEILYVPRRANGRPVKPELMFRILRIPPKLSRERHLEGLRQFSNIHRSMLAKSNPAVMMRPPCAAQETPSSPLAGSRVSAEVEVIA